MFTLCITQQAGDHARPFELPYLRLEPSPKTDTIELRYVDTLDEKKQWHRTVDADDAYARLLKFFIDVHWFDVANVEQLQA
jgi:hypothetical protein